MVSPPRSEHRERTDQRHRHQHHLGTPCASMRPIHEHATACSGPHPTPGQRPNSNPPRSRFRIDASALIALPNPSLLHPVSKPRARTGRCTRRHGLKQRYSFGEDQLLSLPSLDRQVDGQANAAHCQGISDPPRHGREPARWQFLLRDRLLRVTAQNRPAAPAPMISTSQPGTRARCRRMPRAQSSRLQG